MRDFSWLARDSNPIHAVDPSGGGRVVVHRMLTANLFLSIFGMLIPRSVYWSQTLAFQSQPLLRMQSSRGF